MLERTSSYKEYSKPTSEYTKDYRKKSVVELQKEPIGKLMEILYYCKINGDIERNLNNIERTKYFDLVANKISFTIWGTNLGGNLERIHGLLNLCLDKKNSSHE